MLHRMRALPDSKREDWVLVEYYRLGEVEVRRQKLLGWGEEGDVRGDGGREEAEDSGPVPQSDALPFVTKRRNWRPVKIRIAVIKGGLTFLL